MLNDKAQALLQEPGCAKNRAKSDKDRKAGCKTQLVPGSTAGGCAFDGAMIVLQPITDAVHLVHGPIACAGNSWDSRMSLSSGSEMYREGLTTDLNELDVIYGGEKRLFRAIKSAIDRFDPEAVFVYQTCVTAMIGDDIEKVCKVASEKYGKPCIPVSAPGFAGKKNFGTKLAGQALLDYVIGTEEPEDVTDMDINIIGQYNVAGDDWQIRPLLEKLGIRVRASITGDGRYHDIAKAHRARVNMIVCSQALMSLARKMEERWGIPYFEGSFYGVSDTSNSLRTIARMLVDRGASPQLIDKTEDLIREEEAKVRERLAPFREVLKGKRILLYTGGVKSWSVISALQDVGMEIIGSSMRKATKADAVRAQALLGEAGELYGTLGKPKIYKMLKNGEADMLLSGGRTQFAALKARVPWLNINQERETAYAGYTGIVNLISEIAHSISNPVWRQVRTPPPWEA